MRTRFPAMVVLAVVVTLLAGFTPAAATPGWQPRPATYGVTVQSGVRVPMSDGLALVADVIRPAGPDGRPAPGRFPVVVTQTAYNGGLPAAGMHSNYLVQRGYVQVSADVRGTGSSPGSWDAFGPREQRDGYDLVQWAAAQPWSDGRVGLHGESYGAINQLLTAAQQPPALRAIFPVVPMGDAYRDVAGSGGQVDSSFIPLWLLAVTALGVPPSRALPADPAGAVSTLLEHAGGALSFQGATILNALAGEDAAFDGPFWQQRSPLAVLDKVRVPTFVVGGQQDLFQRSEPLLYQRLAAAGVPSRLLFGPWTHAGTVAAVDTLNALELRWFDHYVRGLPDPGLDTDIAPVTAYDQGTGRYERDRQWPPSDVRYEDLALRPGFAPWNPLAGACSASLSQWTAGLVPPGPGCTGDNRVNDELSAVYDFPVTGAPLRLAGPMSAHLSVSTPAKDGQLTVRVEDVAPDGAVHQISAGWQVLSLRALDRRKSQYQNGKLILPFHPDTRTSALPVPPDQPVGVDVEIFPAVSTVAPGHRLRVAVQTFDFPHLTPPLPQLLHSAGPGIRIWQDPAHPSYLTIPRRG